MKKRLLSALLLAALVLSLAPAALAAAAPDQEQAAEALAALDIMVGDENGNLNLGNTVTRAEFTKLAVAASTARDGVGDAVSVKPYPDVPQNHWAAPYIKAAVDLGLVEGDLQGYFNPQRSITLAEGVTIVLRLLGYTDSDFTGVWPAGQMAQYRALGLDAGVSAGQNSAMTRADAMYLFYNLLTTKTKQGSYYLNTLEPTLNLVSADGELDRVALVNSAMDGPVVANAAWQGQIPFDVTAANVSVTRNGAPSTAAAVQEQDVLYWSESMHRVWAYSNKVSGTYEAAAPSSAAPSSVTVAGKTYAIETTAAAYDLSDLGEFRVGDSITLLLGRGDGVAAVVKPGQTGSASLVYGVVTAVTSVAYDDGKGGTYNADTATIAATDGSTYSYQVDNRYIKAGDLVRIDSQDGQVKLTRQSSSSLTGRMNTAGTKLGSYELAEDVEILDTYETCTPIRVYSSRLAGVDFQDDMVRFYTRNAQGEIDRLILNDVTGDLHRYGVITAVTEVNMGVSATASSYQYDVGGSSMVFGAENKVYGLVTGPVQVKMDGAQSVERLYNLEKVQLDTVSGNTALDSSGRARLLADDVVVYTYADMAYRYLGQGLSQVAGGGYTLTGWYDKTESEGGRIRVIVAVPQ